MLVVLFSTFALIGCVNKVSSQKATSNQPGVMVDAPVVIPEAVWGRKYFQLDPSFVCSSESGDSNPGYRRSLIFTADRQILEGDPCSQLETPLSSKKGLEFSRDGLLVGHYERLFQFRNDPKSTTETYVEAFCTNSLVNSDGGQLTPVEIRLTATPQPSIASFSWILLGENYISLVTDNLKMARSQSSSSRNYVADEGSVGVDIMLSFDPARNNLYPSYYRMGNGVAFDLYCRLSR